MSFMPTFGGFQKGGAAKFGIASQMAARTPEPMPNDFVAASGAAVFDLKYACPRLSCDARNLRLLGLKATEKSCDRGAGSLCSAR